MNIKSVLKFLISLGIAFGLLWFVLKDMDLATLWLNIKNANYFWVFIAAGLALLAHWSRAYRWKLMLQPLGYDPSGFRSTIAVLIGYITNLVLPRAGEFARSASLQDLEKVPFEKSFGAVVAERLIDVLVLVLLILLNLLLEFDRVKDLFVYILGEKFSNPLLLGGIGLAFLLMAFLVFQYLKKNDEKLSQNALYAKIRKIVLGLWDGFSSVKNLKNPAAFLGHTVLIWVCYYFMTWLICFALPQTAHLGPLAGLSILVMGTIGMAAPTVGGIGSYHFMVSRIVSMYGISAEDGITLATFIHTVQGIFFIVIFGLTALAISFFIRKKDQLS